MTHDPRRYDERAPNVPTLSRYLTDPAFAAALDAERDARRDAWFAEQDARKWASLEAVWKHEEGNNVL